MVPTFPGGRHCIEQAFSCKGLTPEAIKISLSSISTSTLKQYESSLRIWWTFCHLTRTPVFSAEIPEVLRFLSIEYDKGAAYGTINSIRSALSLIIDKEIGQNEQVKRFCKGVSRLRPAMPKYKVTWEPQIVLDFLSQWTPNEDIFLKQLAQKLVTLMALATRHRIQTLFSIEISNITVTKEALEIKIPAIIKSSKNGIMQPNLKIPFFEEDSTICVATALQTYLQCTSDFRTDQSSALFSSDRKEHKPVSKDTLSRWIKGVLEKSGVDTTIFSAHSTRHASTLAAKRAGVSIDIIKEAAGWSNKSQTFARFYNRELISDKLEFARAVFSAPTREK